MKTLFKYPLLLAAIFSACGQPGNKVSIDTVTMSETVGGVTLDWYFELPSAIGNSEPWIHDMRKELVDKATYTKVGEDISLDKIFNAEIDVHRTWIEECKEDSGEYMIGGGICDEEIILVSDEDDYCVFRIKYIFEFPYMYGNNSECEISYYTYCKSDGKRLEKYLIDGCEKVLEPMIRQGLSEKSGQSVIYGSLPCFIDIRPSKDGLIFSYWGSEFDINGSMCERRSIYEFTLKYEDIAQYMTPAALRVCCPNPGETPGIVSNQLSTRAGRNQELRYALQNAIYSLPIS